MYHFCGIIDVKQCGALGDGIANDTAVIQQAIDACSLTGGTVCLPPGVYSTGTLFLKSDVTLHLSKGATLLGRPDLTLFPHLDHQVPSTVDKAPWRAFIYAYDQQNISVTGEGRINPNGGHEVFQDHIGDSPDRPYGLHFIRCRHVRVSTVSIINPAFWTQRYFECEDVTIQGVSVFAHANYNNDGLDIDGCKRVIVSDCRIDSSDDALVIKAHGNRPCEEVVVTNCILSSHASGIKLGTGSVGGYRKISITNCIIKPSIAESVHHPSKVKNGLIGINLGNVDGGCMEDIAVSHIHIEGVEAPIFIRLGNRLAVVKGIRPPTAGTAKRLTISHVTALDAGPISSSITSYPGGCIEDVLIQDVRIQMTRFTPADIPRVHLSAKLNQTGTKFMEGNYLNDPTGERVPDFADGYPYARIFDTILPSFGFFVRHVKNITFDAVTVETADGDQRVPFVLRDVENGQFSRVFVKRGAETKLGASGFSVGFCIERDRGRARRGGRTHRI